MKLSPRRIRVIGGGLAGCEAALQLASRGFLVDLYEMRGARKTPAHHTENLAELVCSNSFKGLALSSAHGLFKEELQSLGSFLLSAAKRACVPAGESLAVDRKQFSAEVESLIEQAPGINLHREEVTTLDFLDSPNPTPTLIAAGPLCSDALAGNLFARLGSRRLHFFDAIAPVVDVESVDMNHAFFLNRWEKGDGQDFLNCPMDQNTYEEFVQRLAEADSLEPKPFEKGELFEGCLPVEEMARRGKDTLRFGPMRPVGLGLNTATGKPWHAVLQLRAENRERTLYNMVGFQTRLRHGTQKAIFSMIPALRKAEFVRLGCMHRNTFIEAPAVVDISFRMKNRTPLWFAGQILGAEGYCEAVGTGLYAAMQMAEILLRGRPHPMPPSTCLGALALHLTSPNANFQPMNFNFGLLPKPKNSRKSQRKEYQIAEAKHALALWHLK